jgi:hypothetical protein
VRLRSGLTTFELSGYPDAKWFSTFTVRRLFRRAVVLNTDEIWLVAFDTWPTSHLRLRVFGGGKSYSWPVRGWDKEWQEHFVNELRKAAGV